MMASCGFVFHSIPAAANHRHVVQLHVLKRGHHSSVSGLHGLISLRPIVLLHGVGAGTLLYTELIQILAASGAFESVIVIRSAWWVFLEHLARPHDSMLAEGRGSSI